MNPFFAMEFGKRAAAMEAGGLNVIKLNLGEPDSGAPAAVIEAAREILDGRPLPYTTATGLPELREAISRFYMAAHGVEVDPSRIIVTAGASAALLLLTAALVDPGDEVIVGDPSYPCNRQFLASFGADVKLVATNAKTRFQLNAELVEANWTEKTRGVLITTPSNPTGTSVPVNELRQICHWAKAQGAWRIIDEIYLNLSDRDDRGRSSPTVLSVDPEAIVINSFSKYFGMTGWRLGWCVVPIEMVQSIERLAQNYYICPSTPSQQAALACFKAESLDVCEERRGEFSARRRLVLDGLASLGLGVPVPPDGAFYVYFDVTSTGLTASQFCERLLAEAHVAITPGKDFGNAESERYVRLSYAASQDSLREALRRIGKFLDNLLVKA